MTPAHTCNSCRWCTDKCIEDQTGRCVEPHAPRNAKGQITSRTHLATSACRKYLPIEEEPTVNTSQKPPVKRKKQASPED